MACVIKKFPKEELLGLLDGDTEYLEEISNRPIDTGRWSVQHRLIFKDTRDGTFWDVGYQVGATESQDESPWEYDGDEIDCVQVEPVQVITTKYRPVQVAA